MTNTDPPWWPKPTGRRRASRDLVSREKIIEMALSLIRSEGLESLTMRRLASELNVAPTAIYWWAGNKTQLLAYVADELFGRITLPPADSTVDWGQQMRAVLYSSFKELKDYGALMPLMSVGLPAGPNTLRYLDWIMRHLMSLGLSPEEASLIKSVFSQEVLGGILVAQARPGRREEAWTPGSRLEDLPADQYPALHVAGRAMRLADPFKALDTALDLMIEGLEVYLARRQKRPVDTAQ